MGGSERASATEPQSERGPAASARLQDAWRRSVYLLLIVLATGSVAGRILSVDAVDRRGVANHLARAGEERPGLMRPFLSANDRSRWCTVRSLVEHGTYSIDDVVSEPGWDTIDMVKHDGYLYSSKPPLLATLLAGEYWVLRHLTGWTLGTHPYALGRMILLSIHLPALWLVWWAVACWAERRGVTDWGRLALMAAAVLGTFLTTFAVTLNNHLIAAAAVAVSLEAFSRVLLAAPRSRGYFALAGFSAAFAAANELPALAWWAALTGLTLWQAPRQTLLAWLPASLLVAGGFFGTNWAAHGTMVPAYGHRDDSENWYDYSYVQNGRERESYWRHRQGIDRGEASRGTYALHVLLGHHGIFSLTPMWVLSVAGLLMALGRRYGAERLLAAIILGVSVVCVVFYLMRPLEDRNYGGMTSGFRWVFWLAPLWLWGMLPTLDTCARSRLGRGVALALVGLSVLSASYPTWNPWTHPWLWDLLRSIGWIESV